MVALSPFAKQNFKSPLSVLCRVLYTRNRWRQLANDQATDIQRLKNQLDQALQANQILQGELEVCRLQAQQAHQPTWHTDRPLPGRCRAAAGPSVERAEVSATDREAWLAQ